MNLQPLRTTLLASLTSLTLLLSGCAKNPVTGKTELAIIPEKQEISLGSQSYAPMRQMQGGDYVRDPAITRYVDSVGQRVASRSDRPDLPYEFKVINDSTPNAWALPGGKIAVNRGLLTELESEAELSAVLSHEVVHAAARHGAKTMERGMIMQGGMVGLAAAIGDEQYGGAILGASAVGMSLISSKYSRSHELEADRYGMTYMARAGYNPHAAITLQEKFVQLSKDRKQGWSDGLFASHPPSQARVNANRKTLEELQLTGDRTGRETYQRMMSSLHKSKEAYEALDRGNALLKEKNGRSALQMAERAIAIDPNEAHFHGLKGRSLLHLGNHRAAIASLDKAISLNRGYFDYFLNRSVAHEKLGNRSQAKRDLKSSINLLPTAEGHYILGQLELADKNRTGAIYHFQEAAKSNSSVGKQAKQALMNLQFSEKPQSYLKIQQNLTSEGYLTLTAVNTGPGAVRNVVIAVDQPSRGTQPKRQEFHMRTTIKSGGRHTIITSIGPFSLKNSKIEPFKTKVLSASLIK